MENNIQNKVIWLIDDDDIFHFIFKKQLQNLNPSIKLETFSNGNTGMSRLEASIETNTEVPDYLFLDLNMPTTSGWKFLEGISKFKDQLNKKIKIYLVTSSIDNRDIEKSTQYKEVTEYLIKPISEEKLTTILNIN